MYKIYFENRYIELTNNKNNNKFELYYYSKIKNLKTFIKQFIKDGKTHNIYIYHENIDILVKDFFACFCLVDAAGGVVENSENKILIINRLGRWDLPKGKVHKNENYKTAALREVNEECGISNMKIIDSMPTSYHTYARRGKNILKRIFWYKMKYEGNEKLIPEKEEGITEAIWVKKTKLNKFSKNTYQSLKIVFKKIR